MRLKMFELKRCGLYLGIFFLGLFLFGSTLASNSSTETEFSIDGCTFNFEDFEIGLSAGECSMGDLRGRFYCDDDTVPWITTLVGRGCSMGSATYSLGDDYCCPPGMFCNETSSGLFRCDLRPENCIDQDNEADCEDNACVWMDIESICVENPRDYDCGYYDNQMDCLTDSYSLGTSGVGTELCGTSIECNGETFSVPASKCRCEWYPLAPEGDKCQLETEAVQMYYTGTPNRFECSNVYDLGPCVDGQQNVSWYSESNILDGTFTSTGGTIPTECLDALECNGGEGTRFCGEPIIKLPFFSVASFIVSGMAIALFYFISRRFKYNEVFE